MLSNQISRETPGSYMDFLWQALTEHYRAIQNPSNKKAQDDVGDPEGKGDGGELEKFG
jgi:hypothetical protein